MLQILELDGTGRKVVERDKRGWVAILMGSVALKHGSRDRAGLLSCRSLCRLRRVLSWTETVIHSLQPSAGVDDDTAMFIRLQTTCFGRDELLRGQIITDNGGGSGGGGEGYVKRHGEQGK